MHTRVIKVEHVQLAMWTRKVSPHVIWAAISNGFHTYGCTYRKPLEPYCIPHQPLMLPIRTCTADERLVDNVRISRGAPEVKRIWGLGYRQIKAENKARFR